MACLLIVDDSKTSREALLELLSSEGYECQTAGNGDAALQLLRTQRVDLVLLDITMPGVSGLVVLDEIREDRKNNLSITGPSPCRCDISPRTGRWPRLGGYVNWRCRCDAERL